MVLRGDMVTGVCVCVCERIPFNPDVQSSEWVELRISIFSMSDATVPLIKIWCNGRGKTERREWKRCGDICVWMMKPGSMLCGSTFAKDLRTILVRPPTMKYECDLQSLQIVTVARLKHSEHIHHAPTQHPTQSEKTLPPNHLLCCFLVSLPSRGQEWESCAFLGRWSPQKRNLIPSYPSACSQRSTICHEASWTQTKLEGFGNRKKKCVCVWSVCVEFVCVQPSAHHLRKLNYVQSHWSLTEPTLPVTLERTLFYSRPDHSFRAFHVSISFLNVRAGCHTLFQFALELRDRFLGGLDVGFRFFDAAATWGEEGGGSYSPVNSSEGKWERNFW